MRGHFAKEGRPFAEGQAMMQTIEVLAPGLFTTVQDLGRPGYAEFGVPEGGALDKFALQAANLLVGNEPEAAGLEVTQPGLAVRVLAPTIMAVAGADLGFQINGVEQALWCVHRVGPGDVLSFAGRRLGVRAYVAVAGGIDVPLMLGSRSTYTRGRFGGFQGRALRRGDMLKAGTSGRETVPPGDEAATVAEGLDTSQRGELRTLQTPLRADRIGLCLPPRLQRFGLPRPVRVIAGPQAEAFAPVALRRLVGSPYTVTSRADRMGYRLDGAPLPYATGHGIGNVSDGIAIGSIQVPGDGQPIVLLADRQTIGGYPKIATVISADMDFLAHVWPGEPISFRFVDIDEAQRIRAARHELLLEVARFAQGISLGSGVF